jgi:hypothetical protein
MLKRQPLSSCHASRGGFCAPWRRSVGVLCKTWQSPLASLPKCQCSSAFGEGLGVGPVNHQPSTINRCIYVYLRSSLVNKALAQHPSLHYRH